MLNYQKSEIEKYVALIDQLTDYSKAVAKKLATAVGTDEKRKQRIELNRVEENVEREK